MKNIDQLKQIYAAKIAKKFCNIDNISMCSKENCSCKIAAEVKAYIKTIIPPPYHKLTIDDFHGKYNGKQILSSQTVNRAKEKLVKYCWGDNINLREFYDIPISKRSERSFISERRKKGNNVVIYSDNNVMNNSSGKTFIASLIMQEAIKSRINPGNYIQTYEWLSFFSLESMIKKDDGNSVSYSSTCDWLVVDDIVGLMNSPNMDAYISRIIDPFFMDRLKDGLPTIFVFRFDVSKYTSILEKKFGIAMSKIINDSNTYTISLTS